MTSRRLPFIVAMLLANSCTAPPEQAGNAGQATETTSFPDIVAAQEALSEVVMALEGVVGTAVADCDGQPCIRVFVATADEELAAGIPDHFGGFPVGTEVTGEMRVRPDSGGPAGQGGEPPPGV